MMFIWLKTERTVYMKLFKIFVCTLFVLLFFNLNAFAWEKSISLGNDQSVYISSDTFQLNSSGGPYGRVKSTFYITGTNMINEDLTLNPGTYPQAVSEQYYQDDMRLYVWNTPSGLTPLLQYLNKFCTVPDGYRINITDLAVTPRVYSSSDTGGSVLLSGATTSFILSIERSDDSIVIDWSDFPGIELPEMDFAAPVITVTRSPSSVTEAASSVTLTIKASDPNGHDDPLPISINGQDYVASPATYRVTENQAISVIAKDTFGNVREYTVNVDNIDSEAPVITNVQQSSETWTNGNVKLTVTASDDVKLHKTSAYKYEFTPNNPNSSAGSSNTGWVSSRFFTVPDAGTVKITVRDSLGKESTPEVYNVVNIDKIAPTATYELATTDKVSVDDGVLVSLKINDVADPVTQESSGLSVNCVKWDTNSPWESATEKVFHENGVYHVKVKDAVGNVSEDIQVTVNNISTDKPVITSFTRDKTDNGYVTAPVTIAVNASGSNGTALDARPYSWDGGNTWTSVNSLKVYENKEYGVMVRDAAGNTVEAYMPVLNIDSVKPTASLYMVKGAPNDDPDAAMEDWVWKLRVEADDIGSGVKAIDTLWDNQSYSSSPVVIEIAEAGIYGVTVTDNAGNQSYIEKVVTEESIGGAGGSGNGEYVDVKVPEAGSAGDYFNAAIGDLVYGRTGAYNKVTKEFKTYKSGEEGITINLVIGSKSGRYVTGTVNFNNMDYTLLFNGNEETAKGKRSIPASVFIPISGLATDINNGRIRITVKEYSDSALENHVRDGVAQLYTNVQISDPTIMYTYDSVADKLTISAVSTVAGIKEIAYDIGSGSQSYTEPVSVGSASSVTMVAEDNVGGRVQITKTAEELELNGGGGGSLPVEAGDGSISSFYQSSNAYESYIIGGSRTNTDNLPASSVYDALLQGAA